MCALPISPAPPPRRPRRVVYAWGAAWADELGSAAAALHPPLRALLRAAAPLPDLGRRRYIRSTAFIAPSEAVAEFGAFLAQAEAGYAHAHADGDALDTAALHELLLNVWVHSNEERVAIVEI